MAWEKIFANKIYENGLISKIYKKLINSMLKSTNSIRKKWAKNQNTYFSKKHTYKQPTD